MGPSKMVCWHPDRAMSLDQLEGKAWGEPSDASGLVATCHRLRRKPIGAFTVEDMRVMIGQGIGVDFLFPLALEHLTGDPLVSGDYYPGDLLGSVLRLEPSFWRENPDARVRIETILQSSAALPDKLAEPIAVFRASAV